MNKFKVYLAGPITGLSYNEITSWRNQVSSYLTDVSNGRIECYSPLRSKECLSSEQKIELFYDHDVTLHPKAIMQRDHFDCMTADLIFVNMLQSKSISVGTVMEIAWSYAYRKPLVLVMEENNIHIHPMVEQATLYQVGTIEEGAILAKQVLLPY